MGKTTNSYKVLSLINGTPYQLRLKAKDTVGNWSLYSEELNGSPGEIGLSNPNEVAPNFQLDYTPGDVTIIADEIES
ncbi:hypothetical protein [Ammoniphilus sp. YIM 78166]|uniref:hypothetical protein n=1 Tax=Ammoniphilus sp. YIM 78166 TaxID=1644106 RepID=UPI00143175A2|nr:hypothetical protein [Ammoniphilus sp. YIM 78166]